MAVVVCAQRTGLGQFRPRGDSPYISAKSPKQVKADGASRAGRMPSVLEIRDATNASGGELAAQVHRHLARRDLAASDTDSSASRERR